MRDFFAGLRLVLAYTDLEKMNLGSVVWQFIREDIIPKLQKKLDSATTDNEKARLVSLIEEYEKYSTPGSPEARLYNKTAANIVRTLAQRSSMSDEDAEDLMQQLAVDFYVSLPSQAIQRKQERGEKPSAKSPSGHTLADYISTTDIMGGPLAINKMWMRNVQFRTQFRIRELQRRHQEQIVDMQETDEGEELSPMSLVRAPSQIDEGYVRQVMKDLETYVHKNVRNSKYSELFDVWFDLAQKKGADKVRMDRDVYSVLRDRGFEGTEPTFNYHWMEVKRIIARFFQKELEGEGYNGIKKILRMSSVEFVAYTEYRRRLAAWVLEGVDRKLLEV